MDSFPELWAQLWLTTGLRVQELFGPRTLSVLPSDELSLTYVGCGLVDALTFQGVPIVFDAIWYAANDSECSELPPPAPPQPA